MSKDYIDIVFDGPPDIEMPKFVEVEDSKGYSINFGKWIKRDDGLWAIRFGISDVSEHIEDEPSQEDKELVRLAFNTEFQEDPKESASRDPVGDLKKWIRDSVTR